MKLFEAFRLAMLNNPKGSRKEQFAAFLETARSEPAHLELLAEDYFYRQAQTWEAREIEPGVHGMVGTPAMQRRAHAVAERAAAFEKLSAKVEAEMRAKIRPFIWLEMEMPNGKKLRHCTGAELARFGGAFTEMSRHLKPTQVVDKHLSEVDLRNIASRLGVKPRTSTGQELHA